MIQFPVGRDPISRRALGRLIIKDLRRRFEVESRQESRIMTTLNWIRCAAIGCSLTLLGSAGLGFAGDEGSLSAAAKAVQGTWTTAESSELDAKWVFKGETLEATVNGMEYVGKIKIDDKAKPHATLDIVLTDGPEDSKGKTAKAIYKLDGDKLVVSVGHPGMDRPKDFEPVPDQVYLFELKKKKA
jgi:uncharacterized protein (TIGR03067 family)